jgi:hypothetical protein
MKLTLMDGSGFAGQAQFVEDEYAPVADLVGRDRHKIDNERFCDRLEKANRTNKLLQLQQPKGPSML